MMLNQKKRGRQPQNWLPTWPVIKSVFFCQRSTTGRMLASIATVTHTYMHAECDNDRGTRAGQTSRLQQTADHVMRSRKRAANRCGWGFFLISPAHLHVRPMGRTCRRAGENELTPIGVKLNGSRALLDLTEKCRPKSQPMNARTRIPDAPSNRAAKPSPACVRPDACGARAGKGE